jgi:hypothetical protein
MLVTDSAAMATFTTTTVASVLQKSPHVFTASVSLHFHFEILFSGSFVIQKQRPEKTLAHIHSKPIIYVSNGGGRDSYIALNDGGFRPMHIAGSSNATYFN